MNLHAGIRALAASASVSGAMWASVASAVTLVPISTPFNAPIGIDHHEPTNKVLMSVYYPSGNPYNLELVAADGSRAQFGTVQGLTEELKIATVRSGACQGGFDVGTAFTGTGIAGQILRIAPDGGSVEVVILPGETGLMRGSLFQDRYGVAGGDLVAVTTAGGVWRVTSAGLPTKIAQIDTHLEGLSTIPDDVAKYGPWAGMILIGAENQSRLYAVDPDSGAFTSYSLGIPPEDIDLIPGNENFFGVNYAGGTLVGAPASDFDGMEGDVLVTQESPGKIFQVHWNGSSFETTELASVTQFEHVTFSPAGIVNLPPPNTDPDCSGVGVDAPALWPPNHKFHLITLDGASDADGDPVTLSITGVTQDEPVDGVADGSTKHDAADGDSANSVYVRAERSGKGDGRVYHIAFTGDDGKGGSCSGSVDVGVPHSEKPGTVAVDSGLAFDSFGN